MSAAAPSSRLRHRLVTSLILAVSVLTGGAVVATPVAADDADIDGVYHVVFTVTKTCGDEPGVGSSHNVVLQVRRLSSSKVDLGGGFVATIDDDLNFDVTVTGDDPKYVTYFEGHFTVNEDGTARIDGTQREHNYPYCGQGTETAYGDKAYTFHGDRRAVAGATPSVLPSASPSTEPGEPEPGSGQYLAKQAIAQLCSGATPSRECDKAKEYLSDWFGASRRTSTRPL